MFYNYWQVPFMSKVQEKIADSKLSNWSKIFVMVFFLDFPLKFPFPFQQRAWKLMLVDR